MNKEVKQVIIMALLNVGFISMLWMGVTFSSHDMRVRNECYIIGIASLPQGVDQTFLQTQSKGYKDCLAAKK